MSPQLVCSTAEYWAFTSIVVAGTSVNVCVFTGVAGFRFEHVTADADEEFDESLLSSPDASWMITKMITIGMSSSPMVRAVRKRFRRFSAASIASRRMSRFWR